jgi:hypothetical protein
MVMFRWYTQLSYLTCRRSLIALLNDQTTIFATLSPRTCRSTIVPPLKVYTKFHKIRTVEFIVTCVFFCAVWLQLISIPQPLCNRWCSIFLMHALPQETCCQDNLFNTLYARYSVDFSSGAGSRRVMRNRLPPNGVYVWPSDSTWFTDPRSDWLQRKELSERN